MNDNEDKKFPSSKSDYDITFIIFIIGAILYIIYKVCK